MAILRCKPTDCHQTLPSHCVRDTEGDLTGVDWGWVAKLYNIFLKEGIYEQSEEGNWWGGEGGREWEEGGGNYLRRMRVWQVI